MANRVIRSPRAVVAGGGAKRQTSWFQFLPASSTETAVGGTIFFSLNAAALALRPFTIVRTRFMGMVVSDNAAGAEQQVGAVGVAVVSDQAVAAGITAVSTPITEMGSDLWFVHELFMGVGSIASAVGNNGAWQTRIDSKAMRRVDIGQDLVVVAEFSAAGGGFTYTLGGRMLVKIN